MSSRQASEATRESIDKQSLRSNLVSKSDGMEKASKCLNLGRDSPVQRTSLLSSMLESMRRQDLHALESELARSAKKQDPRVLERPANTCLSFTSARIF